MARMGAVAQRAEQLLGTAVVVVRLEDAAAVLSEQAGEHRARPVIARVAQPVRRRRRQGRGEGGREGGAEKCRRSCWHGSSSGSELSWPMGNTGRGIPIQ